MKCRDCKKLLTEKDKEYLDKHLGKCQECYSKKPYKTKISKYKLEIISILSIIAIILSMVLLTTILPTHTNYEPEVSKGINLNNYTFSCLNEHYQFFCLENNLDCFEQRVNLDLNFIDCEKNEEVCNKFNVQKSPTNVIFNQDLNLIVIEDIISLEQIIDYTGCTEGIE